MAIITVSKEFAAGGRELARRLAGELGLRLVGREVLAELAKKLDMSEGEVELMHRGQENNLFKLVDEVFLHTVRRIAQKPEAALDDERYYAAVSEFVKGVAAQGDAIIVGWGGQYILADDPGAHHFRVVAPRPRGPRAWPSAKTSPRSRPRPSAAARTASPPAT